jgi:hypothetical protein
MIFYYKNLVFDFGIDDNLGLCSCFTPNLSFSANKCNDGRTVLVLNKYLYLGPDARFSINKCNSVFIEFAK